MLDDERIKDALGDCALARGELSDRLELELEGFIGAALALLLSLLAALAALQLRPTLRGDL